MMLKAKFIMVLFGCAQVAFSSLHAVTSLSLAWDPSPDTVAGYTIWFGPVDGSQTNRADVGNVTSAIIQNLNEGQEYFFYATAYTSDHVASDPSNVVRYMNSNNHPPTIQPIANRFADEGKLLQLTVSATDPDSPAQKVTYSLGTTAPGGSSINTTNGLFSWRPASTQAPSTNWITVTATDNGLPPMKGYYTFGIIVREGYYLTMGSYNNGSVAISPKGTLNASGTKYISGTQVSASAQANLGFRFDHWTLDGASYTANPLPLTMTANHTLTPNFQLVTSGLFSSSTASSPGTTSLTTTQPVLATTTTSVLPTTVWTETNQWVLEASTNMTDWTVLTNGLATTETPTIYYRVRPLETTMQ